MANEHGDDGATYKPIPWRRILRDMAREYQFTPQQVGKMTLYQIRCLLCPDEHLGGKPIKMKNFGAQEQYAKLMNDPDSRSAFMLAVSRMRQ